jgi:hypothetical protein
MSKMVASLPLRRNLWLLIPRNKVEARSAHVSFLFIIRANYKPVSLLCPADPITVKYTQPMQVSGVSVAGNALFDKHI